MTRTLLKPVLLTAAGATAIAASLAGGAYALWSDSTRATTSAVSPGAMDIESMGLTARDAATGERVDLDRWRAMPGSAIEVTLPFDVQLDGEGLRAAINTSELAASVAGSKVPGTDIHIRDHVDIAIDVVDASGDPIPGGQPALQGAQGTEPGIARAGKALDGAADIAVVITVSLHEDAPAELSGGVPLFSTDPAAVVRIEQVRP